ncbi:MAG: FKBP-type peptidyl-prolyl cis-trans isomerase [Ferruginibacter sp.]
MLALPLMLMACKKDKKCPYTTSTQVAGATEIANLKAWLDSSSLTYTQHPSGIFYKVITPGSGPTPGVCSEVTVKYKGLLTNGTGFDSSYTRDPDGSVFTLGELIPAWQIGIPLIQKGGSIILYVPPSMGYGSAANGPIPANSNLIFNVELINVK